MKYGKAVFYSSSPLLLMIGLSVMQAQGILFMIAIVGYFISIFGAIFIGIPTHEILESYNISHWSAYVSVGFLAPIAIIIILTLLSSSSLTSGMLQFSLVMGVIGMLCMGIFWLNVKEL